MSVIARTFTCVIALVYGCLVIYEVVVGGIGANLTLHYYDYSRDNVQIDAFPRDIYKNTETYAGLYICFGILSVFAAIAVFIDAFKCCRLSDNGLSVGCYAHACVSVMNFVSFLYCAFLVWKLNDLSDPDIDFWDSIDERFIGNLHRMQTLIGLLSIVWVLSGSCVVILACCINNLEI